MYEKASRNFLIMNNVLISCFAVIIVASAATACIPKSGSCDVQEPQNCCSGYCRTRVSGPQCIEYGDSSDDTDPNPCDSIQCPAGQSCILRQVQCFRAPCRPIAECR